MRHRLWKWPVGIAGLLLMLPVFAQSAEEQGQLDFADGLFTRGLHEDAVEEYVRYLDAYPEGDQRGIAWFRLGMCRRALGEHPQAVEAFQRARETGEKPETRAMATLRLGVTQFDLGNVAEAEELLFNLAASDTTPAIREESLYHLGKGHASGGKADKALETFTAMLDQYSDGSFADFARYQIGFIYLRSGNLEKAAVAFTEIADRTEANAQLRMDSVYRAAEAYDQLRWFDPAIKSYERLRTEFPDSDYARRATFGYAWALYHAGRFAVALVTADEYLSGYPEDPRRAGMVYLKGNAYQQQKRFQEALDAYKSIPVAFPTSPYAKKAGAKAAWAQHFLGQDDAALRAGELFVQTHPKEPETGDVTFLLGTIHLGDRRFEEAAQWFKRTHKEFPKSEFASEALYKFAESNMLRRAWNDAALAYDAFIATYPKNGLVLDALLGGGDAYAAAGDFARAGERYARRLEVLPEGANKSDTLYRLAVAKHNGGDSAGANALFEQLIQLEGHPYAAESERRVGDFVLRHQKDPIAAIEHFRRAVELDPEGPQAGETKKGMALARFEAKDLDGAAAVFVDIMRNHPSVALNAEAYIWSGQHFFDGGSFKEAAEAWGHLLERVSDYPNPVRVRFSIAEAWEKAGDLEQAMAAYAKAVETAPQTTLAQEAGFRMAGLLEKQGKTEEAFNAYAQAAKSDSGETAARARLRMGEMLSTQEKHDEAAKQFMRVGILFLHPEYSPEGLFRAAESFAKAGNSDQAKSLYEELIRDYPESKHAPTAKTNLDALKTG